MSSISSFPTMWRPSCRLSCLVDAWPLHPPFFSHARCRLSTTQPKAIARGTELLFVPLINTDVPLQWSGTSTSTMDRAAFLFLVHRGQLSVVLCIGKPGCRLRMVNLVNADANVATSVARSVPMHQLNHQSTNFILQAGATKIRRRWQLRCPDTVDIGSAKKAWSSIGLVFAISSQTQG